MISENEVNALYKLFDAVRYFVWRGGGDGDGWIVSHRYKELAGIFREYENRIGKWFTDEQISDGCITFCRGQESVAFIDAREKMPAWAGDIIVELD